MSKESDAKKKDEDIKDYSFDLDNDIEDLERRIDEKISDQKEKKQDELSIEHLKENMPEPGYMKTTLNAAVVKGVDEKGELREEKCVAFEVDLKDKDADFMEITYDDKGTPVLKPNGCKVIIYDPVFSMDLHEHAEGQISDCASTIFPQIADEMVQLALDEKRQRSPELRKPLFNYWWIILLLCMIPVIIITLMIVSG